MTDLPAKSHHIKSAPPSSTGRKRRSPCPVAASLDLFGDRWTLLVVKNLLNGPRRFKDLFGSVEGVPTNILSARLERLCQAGVIIQVAAPGGGKRLAYRLTGKGEALQSVIAAINAWSASETTPGLNP